MGTEYQHVSSFFDFIKRVGMCNPLIEAYIFNYIDSDLTDDCHSYDTIVIYICEQNELFEDDKELILMELKMLHRYWVLETLYNLHIFDIKDVIDDLREDVNNQQENYKKLSDNQKTFSDCFERYIEALEKIDGILQDLDVEENFIMQQAVKK